MSHFIQFPESSVFKVCLLALIYYIKMLTLTNYVVKSVIIRWYLSNNE